MNIEFEKDFNIILEAEKKINENLKMGGGYNQQEVAMKLAMEYFKIKSFSNCNVFDNEKLASALNRSLLN